MVLGEWSDPETDDIIRNMIVDDSQWSKSEPDDMIVDDSEWSNDEPDDMNVDDSEWDNSEADDMIVDDSEWSNDEPDDMNVDDSQWSKPEPDDMFVDDSEWSNDEPDDMNVDDSEWDDSEADDMIVDDSEWSNDEPDDMNVDDGERANPGVDDVIRDIQTGRGEKRKSDEPLLPEKDFYEIESVKKHHSKKFGMTATDHIIRFNTILNEIDLIESYERTQAIFQHIGRCNPGYERERSGTVCVTFRAAGPTYLDTFHPLSPTYNRTGVLPNRTCYTIEPGLQAKRYGNGRHNTRRNTSG